MLGRKAVLTRTLALTAVVLSLSACGRSNSDLRTYIDEVKARPGGRIDALPTVHPAPTFAYEPAGRRSPFVADAPQRRVSTDPNAVTGPDPNRPREFLEQFPLDTMHMVGTLADKRAELRARADGRRSRAPHHGRQSPRPELRPRHLDYRFGDSPGGNHFRRSRRVFGKTREDRSGRRQVSAGEFRE